MKVGLYIFGAFFMCLGFVSFSSGVNTNPQNGGGILIGIAMFFFGLILFGIGYNTKPDQQQPVQNIPPQINIISAPQPAQTIATPPPLPQEKGYFVAANGQRKGPYAISKIMQAYEAKEIHRDTLVWTEGMANWQPLIDVEDFRKLIPNAPNFPPLPPTV